MRKTRNVKEYGTGFSDKFVPLKPLDVNSCKDFDEMLKGMRLTAFGGRNLGEAADVLYEMVTDKDCFVVGTFSGAMTVAKMGLLVCEMINLGMINAVVSTGALIAHGFVESVGMSHFKYSNEMDDKKLYSKGYNRVYDTLELEKNLDDTEVIIDKVFNNDTGEAPLCSYEFCRRLGKYLKENTKGRGILKSAYEKNTPVFIPAFTDSELALDLGVLNLRRAKENKQPLTFNSFLDLNCFKDIIKKQKSIGIFTIGGGVPRNWAQQVAPYIDILIKRGVERIGSGLKYKYGVKICPEPVHCGGLSGCTYTEGISWGKFASKEEGGKFAEVHCDATIAWPILLKAVIQRLEKNKSFFKKSL